jgi:hypothetical protein
MKTFSLILSLVASSMAQIACIQAITTTMTYLPAITLGVNNTCPTAGSVSYYSVEGANGCCTDAATAASIISTQGLACCPCGAQCTGGLTSLTDYSLNLLMMMIGYLPKIQAWTLSGGMFFAALFIFYAQFIYECFTSPIQTLFNLLIFRPDTQSYSNISFR